MDKDLGKIYNKKNYIKFGGSAKENSNDTPIQFNEEGVPGNWRATNS